MLGPGLRRDDLLWPDRVSNVIPAQAEIQRLPWSANSLETQALQPKNHPQPLACEPAP